MCLPLVDEIRRLRALQWNEWGRKKKRTVTTERHSCKKRNACISRVTCVSVVTPSASLSTQKTMLKAMEDVARGAYRHPGMWRTGRNRDGGHICTLCEKGPMQFSQWQAHENGNTHFCMLAEYEHHYDRLRMEKTTMSTMQLLSRLQANPFWFGDLKEFKALAFDALVGSLSASPPSILLDAAWIRHVRIIQAELLLLALTKAHIMANFGSVDEARDAGTSEQWLTYLSSIATSNHTLLGLIMSHVVETIDDRFACPRL